MDAIPSIVIGALAIAACGFGLCRILHGSLFGGRSETPAHCCSPTGQSAAPNARKRAMFALLLSVLGCGAVMFVALSLSAA